MYRRGSNISPRPSAESQDSKLDHSDAVELVSLAEASARKIMNGVDLLAGPPEYPEATDAGITSPSTSSVPEPLQRAESESSQKSSAKTGFAKGLSSLTNSFKAMAAGMRPKPEPFVSALCQAASRGNTQVIKGLLEQGANINGRNEDGNTALIAAILAHQPDTAIFLLETGGADKSVRSSSGKRRPPLYHAIDAGDMKTTQYLLDHGASVNERSLVGQNFFIDVVQSEKLDQIQLLLRYGADIHAREMTGRSIVAWAVTKGNLDLVRILLAHGADPNSRDITATANPIVCIASTKDRPDLLHLLLSAGADPNSRFNTGTTLLVDAVQRGRTDLAEIFLAAGANPNGKDLMGTSILLSTIRHTSLSEMGKESLISLLLTHGADPNVTDSWGLTPLAHAAAADNIPLFKSLLARGADPNQFVHADTLLVNAIDKRRWEQVKLLVDHAADPNKADKVGRTPLIVALQKGEVDMVKLLVERGANVNQTGCVSPMMFARASGNDGLVRLLRDYGAAGTETPGVSRAGSRSDATGTLVGTGVVSGGGVTVPRRESPPPGYAA